MEEMAAKLEKVGKMFCLPGTLEQYEVITVGHINETYRVQYRTPDGKGGFFGKSYIFQKINIFVFRDPEGVMHNIDLTTEHIRAKLAASGSTRPALHFHHTADRKNFAVVDGEFWRVTNYIPSCVLTECSEPEVIRRVGFAFGQFQQMLSDLDGSLLYETIPHFHDTEKRLQTMFAHEAENPLGKNAETEPERAYLHRVFEKASELSVRFRNGEFPVRVTHNDTKANNVLFSGDTKEPLTVIDLDTVMPGMGMYDFADAVRFICNTCAEDEKDLSKVELDLEKFRVLAEGFLEQVKDSWTAAEVAAMVQASFAICVETGSRFLDDYLTGDHYFRTAYPGHNLVRARCQLQLARSIEEKWEQMQKIIESI